MALPKRQRWKASDARQVLAAWEASGKSMDDFAREAGVELQRLERWRKRLGEAEREAVRLAPLPAFVPATIIGADAGERTGVVVAAEGGIRIEVRDPAQVSPAWVAELVSLLGAARA